MLNENNKLKLEFSQTDQIYKVYFSPRKDYFITSMNNLEQDIKNDRVLDKIKEFSEKSYLLLEKGPAYINDIKIYTFGEVFQKQQWRK